MRRVVVVLCKNVFWLRSLGLQVLLKMEVSNQAPEVKLADLGMTAMMHQEYSTRVMGEHTVPYLAPEAMSSWSSPQVICGLVLYMI